MNYQVSHTTTYEYTEPVALCHNLAHLTPRTVDRQRCQHSSLAIEPSPDFISERVDYFGNPAIFFAVQKPHRKLIVNARHFIEVTPQAAAGPPATPSWENVRHQLQNDRSPAVLDSYQMVFDARYARASPEAAAYARPSFDPGRPLFDAVLDLTRRIHHDFLYDPRATTVATPLQEVFAHRRGVCQDFAHLQIACLRSLGLAARYISGYLCTQGQTGQNRLVGADASHAWVAVFCPGHGWLDVDPTNNQIPGVNHLVLAWGRDYDDVSPIRGVILGGGNHTVKVGVDVVRQHDGELRP
jgi:transglutaminase-like putative cysteine protease